MPRQKFLRSFNRRLPPIARLLAVTHRELYGLNRVTQGTEQNATIHMFLHAALNSAYTSTLLLIEGYPLASGFLMRHYTEASAMALLLLDEDANVWLHYASKSGYPVQKAPHRLLQKETAVRLRRLVAFDAHAWRRYLALAKFYDQFNHASVLSLGFHMMFDRPGVIILGAEFDPGKRKQVGIELRRRRSALQALARFVRVTRRVLTSRVPERPPV